MLITVVGLGYVGLTAATNLAVAGHHVIGVDVDSEKLKMLKSGEIPFYEPGLQDLLHQAIRTHRLNFHHRNVTRIVGDVTLICVGTPQTESGAADLRQMRSAVEWVKNGNRKDDVTIVMKSTVPPGTGQAIIERELANTYIRYISNPEFLREGQAIHDWQNPDRIVAGIEPTDTQSEVLLHQMYRGIDAPMMVTSPTSAEMIKYASNALLATRISFINEIASLCERVGADVEDVSEGLAMDPRTGSQIHAGVGYGGSCFPKDTRALDYLGMTSGASTELLRSVININNRQKLMPLHALRQYLDLRDAKVAVLGLSFKPDTDDVRDAPALDLIRALVDAGAQVSAYDPQAGESVKPHISHDVHVAFSSYGATLDAQAIVLMTEWDELINTNWSQIAGCMFEPRLLFDGRNALDGARMRELGFQYIGVGRPCA